MTWNFALTTTPARWVGRGSVALRSAIVRSRCARDAPVLRACAARAPARAAGGGGQGRGRHHAINIKTVRAADTGTNAGLGRRGAVLESQWHKAGIRRTLVVATLGVDAVKAPHHIAVHHVDHGLGYRVIHPLAGQNAFLDDERAGRLTV